MKNKLDASVTSERELRSFFYQVLGFDVTEQTFVLITGHRRENMGDGFDEIFGAVNELATKHPSVSFVYPVHLNPRVKVPAQKLLGHIPNVHLIEPLQYKAFVYLLSHCYMLLTDSGGLQEKAPSLGKPVLVMRDLTERPEALQAGTIKLVGCDRDKIIESVSLLLEDLDLYASMSAAENPFGDGRSAVKITTELERYFDGGKQ